jgi:splicing factor 3A subunit 1
MVALDGEEPAVANGTNGAIIAVGEVQSASLPAPDLKGIQEVATHTKALGIILPPPDIRAIIDKTAQFVARNGTDTRQHVTRQHVRYHLPACRNRI